MDWRGLTAAAIVAASSSQAAEQSAVPVPPAVVALTGCWQGAGSVMGKEVTLTLTVKPIVEGAMVSVDALSQAKADARDRYAAHLLFGGAGATKPGAPAGISAFWSDSFGGTATAVGAGNVRKGGFDVSYHYPDSTFINRWRQKGDALDWVIVSQEGGGTEVAFGHYGMKRAACPQAVNEIR